MTTDCTSIRVPEPGTSRMLNLLRRGLAYRATTTDGRSAVGEYLGIEVSHGDRSILLTHRGTTESIAVDDLARLLPHVD